MQALDFLYEVDEIEEKEIKKRGASWLNPKNAQDASWTHIAMNVFGSIYPKWAYANLYLNTPESQANRNKKLNQLRIKIWNKAKQFIEETGLTQKAIQQAIIDPNNELGQRILKKVDPQAQLVGISGEDLKNWSKISPIEDTGKPEDLPKKSPIEQNSEILNRLEKESELLNRPQEIVKSLAGRSKYSEENREEITAFIEDVLADARGKGYLKQIRVKGSGEGGRYTQNDMSGAEYGYTQAVKTIYKGLAWYFAYVIMGKTLISSAEHLPDELESEEKENITIKQVSKDVNQDFKKILERTGISMLPDVHKTFLQQVVEACFEALELAGYIGELENGEWEIQSRDIDDTDPNWREAIDLATNSINNLMNKTWHFIDMFVSNTIDVKEIKRFLTVLDPTVKDKMSGINLRNKWHAEKFSQQVTNSINAKQEKETPEEPGPEKLESFVQYLNRG